MGILRYTGHPFIDVGVATITAFVDKKYPSEVVMSDLTEIALYLKRVYTDPQYKLFQNLISSVFLNAHFSQPAKSYEQKLEYADEILFAWRDAEPIEDIMCTFFPEKSAVLYAHRQHIPLLNGRDIGNFSANGQAGLPISGEALLAIHALPLGCLKCGNLLAFHQATNPLDPQSGSMNVVMAKRALKENKRAIANLAIDPSEPIPSFGSAAKSRYIDEILRAQEDIQRREGMADTSFISAYSFSNYGPSPRIEIIQLEQAIFNFMDAAQHDAGRAWNNAVYRAWRKPKDDKDATPDENNTRYWRNALYDDLFNLPQNTLRFINTHLRYADWHLIEIFLRKVLQMDQDRINAYRALGDKLAQYMLLYEAPSNSFYVRMSRAKNYTTLRDLIRSAEDKQLKKQASPDADTEANAPIMGFDEFIAAFEHPSEGYSQWRLGRDLIAMRLREAIYANRQKFDLAELQDLPEEELTEEE